DGGYLRLRRQRIEDRNLRKAMRKPGKAVRKRGKARSQARRKDASEIDGATAMTMQMKEMPTYRVAYMRYVGPYGAHGIPEHWGRFVNWMDRRGLAASERTTLGVAYDDPNVTAEDKCRYDACVVVADDFQPDRWVNVTTVPGGRYAVADFTG